ncbi:MAG: hypothetical protein JNK53_00560, partial [Phycisphaerae bacterium]|nr:hypothetical protein [Phycisphaerae bacterium]
MQHRERVQAIVSGATALTPAQRPAYLDAACNGDTQLRSEVESLLRAQVEAPRQDTAALENAKTLDSATTRHPAAQHEGPGTLIGPYKLLQLI